MNQAAFFEAHQVDGELTDAQNLQMLGLPEGDSNPAPQQAQEQSSETPAAADESGQQQTETPKVEDETPVVLARDGKHTIPYEQLEDARKAAQLYKQQAEEYQRKLDELQAQAKSQQAQEKPQASTATGWISKEEIASAFGDFSEEGLANGIASLVDKRAESLVAAVEAKAEAKAIEKVRAEFEARELAAQHKAHFDAIHAAHPDAESIAQSQELAAWIKQQPSYAQAGISYALQQGTAAQVIEALDAFKASTTTKSAATAPAPQAAKPDASASAAKAVIAKAKSAPPLSLSAFPAGASAAVDEANAVLQMSDGQLLNSFFGKSPEQSSAILSRVL